MKIDRLKIYLAKSIPYAFDNSESWLEFLANILAKLNEVIDEVNSYFSEDIEVHIEKIMTDWMNDGTLITIIENHIDAEVTQRIDEATNTLTEAIGTIDGKIVAVNDKIDDFNDKYDQLLLTSNINVLNYGAKNDYNPTTMTGVSSYNAFVLADLKASQKGGSIYVPEGYYLIDQELNIKNSMTGEGVLCLPNNITNARINLKSETDKYNISKSGVSGLNKGSNKIEGLMGYKGMNLIIESSEELIKRYNPPGNETYTKKEIITFKDNEGNFFPQLEQSYDMSKVSLYVKPLQKKTEFSVDILCVGTTDKNGYTLKVERSNTTIKTNIRCLNSTSVLYHVALDGVTNVTFDNCIISDAFTSGFGYGISLGLSSFITINNCVITNTRHAISGTHSNHSTINGGIFDKMVDLHWGYNFTINNAVIYNGVSYAGSNIAIKNTDFINGYFMLATRSDTPEITGYINIQDCTINTPATGYYRIIYNSTATYPVDFFGRNTKTPNILIDNISFNGLQETSLDVALNFMHNYQQHRNIELKNMRHLNNGKIMVYTTNVDAVKENTTTSFLIDNCDNLEIVGADNATNATRLYLNINNSKDVIVKVDASLIDYLMLTNCKVKSLTRIKETTSTGVGATLTNCLLDTFNSNLDIDFDLIGCKIRGVTTIGENTRPYLRLSNGTSLIDATFTTPWSIDFANYKR